MRINILSRFLYVFVENVQFVLMMEEKVELYS